VGARLRWLAVKARMSISPDLRNAKKSKPDYLQVRHTPGDSIAFDVAMPPTSDEQIRFVVNIQRLLDEGLFTASCKFALLLALAVLSIEQGDDSGAPLEVTTDAIAEKFVLYYWR
jgi:hypothetical protein